MTRTAFFLAGTPGYRFALHHRPDTPVRAALLLLPPWAEELNKMRRVLAHAAQAFAQAGFAVLQLDLLGCGDSSGDFADASWDAWQQDIRLGQEWLREQHPEVPLIAWGVRAGCLLGQDLAWDARLWWQPALQGKTVLQQFLRLRLAAELGQGQRGNTAALLADLASGATVCVAGYGLRQGLSDGLASAQLNAPDQSTLWLEVQTQDAPQLLPASERLLQQWARPERISAQAVQGPQPWATTELEDCPALAQTSLSWLQQQRGQRA
ncbi:hydrolase 2, exosortase A system-associated [Inhella proteolytica]|uniref:Hydrolase 2, exosortase A system-associated n=1 Tax=Inhella proteolytica TaxID=2795029 RepID=A0A931IZ70_9BURK|nr:hydrolase 2, exosortase A system-associated [Inhella proteolytica]MBH9576501.1 hydrolase 2, exosortase A system-associated [Inhella proteolytica]